ncbi:MAG: ABC transporter ATP-binding protein [Planctomycetota bacterium]
MTVSSSQNAEQLSRQTLVSERAPVRPATARRALIEVEHLSKTYRVRTFSDLLRPRNASRIPALSDVSLKLYPGEVTALLGPNGAGKTTLINIVCDLTRSDSGAVRVAGYPVPRESRRAQREIGVVTTNDRSFFWRLSGRHNLEFFAALHGIPRRLARERSRQMLERFGLSSHADRLFRTYSAGMKKRLGLARAFLHDPAVLLMDESTSGLDAAATEDLLQLVDTEVRSAGKCVLWATHRAEEVERLCDRVLVLGGGRLLYDGRVEHFRELGRRRSGFLVEVRLPPTGANALLAHLRQTGATVATRRADGSCELTGIEDERRLSALLTAVLDAEGTVTRVERRADPLHIVFEQLAANGAEP